MKRILFLMLSVILIATALCFCASAMTEPDITICGAGLRVADNVNPFGLRFLTRVDRTNDSVTMVEEGTLIIPERHLSGELTLDTAEALVIKKVANRYYAYAENYYEYTGVLVDIPVSEYNTSIAARAYAKYTVGDDDTVYTAYSNTLTRSVLGIAEDVLADTSVDAEMKAAIQLIVDEYNAQNSQPSIGLKYDTNGDGTCYLVGIGDCKDTDIVIPETSPDGDTVFAIDRNAFADEAITSITIPTTIEEIGRNAFNGCDSLTDVYYLGTEAEWEALCEEIGAGNNALFNANIHFAEESVTYDGPTIVVESVTAGAGDTVEVTVSVVNNPGICGAKFELTHDKKLQFVGAIEGTAFDILDYTVPESLVQPYYFNWDGMNENSTKDGVLLTLTFKIDDTAEKDKELAVRISYTQGDVYNVMLDDVSLDIVNGNIVVK